MCAHNCYSCSRDIFCFVLFVHVPLGALYVPDVLFKPSKQILSQCFSLFFTLQITDWFIIDTAERARKCCRQHQFVCCSQLAECCSWIQHLLRAADTICVSQKLRKVLRFNARCGDCFIKRISQDLMVINVSYSASHPHRSAVTHRSQVYTVKLLVIRQLHQNRFISQ